MKIKEKKVNQNINKYSNTKVKKKVNQNVNKRSDMKIKKKNQNV